MFKEASYVVEYGGHLNNKPEDEDGNSGYSALDMMIKEYKDVNKEKIYLKIPGRDYDSAVKKWFDRTVNTLNILPDSITKNLKLAPPKNFNDTIVLDKVALTATIRSKLIKKLDKIRNIQQEKGGAPELGISSLLPGDIGRKIQSVTVNETATTQPSFSKITFKGVTLDELSNSSGSSPGLEWHLKGSTYRVWTGTYKYGAVNPDIRLVFYGYVTNTDYEYGESGITVTLTIVDVFTARSQRPINGKLWDRGSTIKDLLKTTGAYIGVETVATELWIDDPQTKALMAETLGFDDFEDDPTDLTFRTYKSVQSYLNSWYASKQGIYSAAEMLSQLFGALGGVRFKWFLSTNGVLFFGIPMNPEDKVASKKFYYRKYFQTAFGVEDYIDRDPFKSFSIRDTKKLEETKTHPFLEGINITVGKDEKNDPASNKGSFTTDTGEDQEANAKTGKNIIGENINEAAVLTSIFGDGKNKELVKALNEDVLSNGQIVSAVTGCVMDSTITVAQDVYYFEGLPRHTGNWLITGIERTFSVGSKPEMTITGVKPLDYKEIIANISKATIEGLTTQVKNATDASGAKIKDSITTSEVNENQEMVTETNDVVGMNGE